MKPVLVLGTDDIASAVGHALASAGVAVVLARDPMVPVLRRGMSFDDALEYASVRLDGLTAFAAPRPPWNDSAGALGVTALTLTELLDTARIEGVIDARMRRRDTKTDLRGRSGFAIGLGPGFVAGGNVDIAVETAPQAAGAVLRKGATIPAHGQTLLVNGAAAERFARAPRPGLWWTFREIGEAVEQGAVIGLCGGMQVPAPIGGALLGLVRRGTDVAAGTRLLEVDPHGEAAPCHGIPRRAAVIAAASLAALRDVWATPRVAADRMVPV
jgi:hypothetical protein